MAGTLTINVSHSLVNGKHKESFNPGTIIVTQTNLGAFAPTISVGTTEEVIPQTDIGTLGWCVLQNLDATNFVEFGPESAGVMVGFVKLKAGEHGTFRLKPGIVIRGKADTAAVEVKIIIYED
mgnify:CR=1 FL=1